MGAVTIGERLGNYRILGTLGEGGMGVVYRARDERVDREVAIKVLPSDTLTTEAARRRFAREATTLARLNHPNIEILYEFDSRDGVDFLVMEYVPGATLATRLAGGRFHEADILPIAAQIVAGLEEAHDHGVIHRDLKPSNIGMTPRDRIKILDFGLARQLPNGVDLTVTSAQSDTLAGTLPYMAPEQLRGAPADVRSDLYSFGVTLYELSTGRRPFPQTLSPALIDAILHQAVVPPRAVSAEISTELERIILKCLDKDPKSRYQSAKEIGADLHRLSVGGTAAPVPRSAPVAWRRIGGWGLAAIAAAALVVTAFQLWGADRRGAASSPDGIRSIAVLPLQNLSGDPQQEYFADGMTEALITELAQISALRVISRTSVMPYKRAPKPLPEIARELNVDAIIEGSVQRSSTHVQITVQLIDAPHDRHLWARPYDRDLRDVLALQRELARAIAGEIRVRLTPNEQQHLAAARQVDRDAYEAFLHARDELRKGTSASVQVAIDHLQDAIRIDPQYAPAHVALAGAYQLLGGVRGFKSPQDTFPKAREYVNRALELDPDNPTAHGLLARQRLQFDWNWRGAAQEFARALELNGNDPDVHQDYGTYLEAVGRFDEAITARRRAADLDPRSGARRADVGYPLYYAGRCDDAIAEYRRGLEIDPGFYWAHSWIGQCHVEQGRFDDAIAAVTRAIEAGERNVRLTATLGFIYGKAGRTAEALAVLRQLEDRSRDTYVSPYFFAVVNSGLGHTEEALAALERAADEHHPYIVLMNVEPVFAAIRSDRRFQQLLRRIGLSTGAR